MNTIFQKYATPISIIVAGVLIGAGIIISKAVSPSSSTPTTTPETTATDITSLPILKKLSVKPKDLTACIENEQTKARVEGDIALGQASGLRGTPHMIVIMNNGTEFQLFGALDKASIEQAINEGKTPAAQASYTSDFEPQQLTADDHIKGDPTTAKATIIEYSDIDCPFCKKIHPTLQQLVDAGTIAWVYRHSPIPSLHPDATRKAIATECVYEVSGKNNDAFWSYLDALVS